MEGNYYRENYDFISSFNPISKKSFEALFSISKLKKVKANTKLIDEGVIPTKFYMINKGVVRSFVRLANGKEVTKSLFTPLMLFTSFTALLEQKPTESIYEVLTDCDIQEIDFNDFYTICNENKEVMTFYVKFLEYLLKTKDELNIEILSLDAKGRYLKLRKRIPNIDNLIPQYQIASYLNVTPVQLSRIRTKLLAY